MPSRSCRWYPAIFVLAAACASPDADAPGQDVTEAEQHANPDALVDTEWVRAHLDDPAVRLVDVSARRAVYDEGHLPGAQFVGWNTDLVNAAAAVEGQILTRDSLSSLMSRLGAANEHTVVLYDNASNLFAARAYWVLRYYGHEDVRVYDGGSRKWVSDGHQLTDIDEPPAPANYVANEPDPSLAADWEQVVTAIDDPSTNFCDTRSPDEHAGVDVRAERGGSIPGSVNIEWTRNVRDDGTFLDARTLHDLYREAGFSPERRVVTYCQTGVRGAHTWFVLSELLGYPDVRNYDGSWAEYGNRADSPIR